MSNAPTRKIIGRPFQRIPDPDAATLADLRRRYDARDITAADLAREIGVSPGTLAKRLTEWGWRRRGATTNKRVKPAKSSASGSAKRPVAPPDAATGPDDAGPIDFAGDLKSLRRTLLGAAHHNVRELKDRIALAAGDQDVERLSRVAASIVKTIAELARLEGGNGTSNDNADSASSAETAADLARIKSDLVERIVAATAGAGTPPDSDEP